MSGCRRWGELAVNSRVNRSVRAKPSMSRPTGTPEEIQHRRRDVDHRAARQPARSTGAAVRQRNPSGARSWRAAQRGVAERVLEQPLGRRRAAPCRTARRPAGDRPGRADRAARADLGVDEARSTARAPGAYRRRSSSATSPNARGLRLPQVVVADGVEALHSAARAAAPGCGVEFASRDRDVLRGPARGRRVAGIAVAGAASRSSGVGTGHVAGSLRELVASSVAVGRPRLDRAQARSPTQRWNRSVTSIPVQRPRGIRQRPAHDRRREPAVGRGSPERPRAQRVGVRHRFGAAEPKRDTSACAKQKSGQQIDGAGRRRACNVAAERTPFFAGSLPVATAAQTGSGCVGRSVARCIIAPRSSRRPKFGSRPSATRRRM